MRQLFETVFIAAVVSFPGVREVAVALQKRVS